MHNSRSVKRSFVSVPVDRRSRADHDGEIGDEEASHEMLKKCANHIVIDLLFLSRWSRSLHLVMFILFVPCISKSQFRLGRINPELIQSQPEVRKAILNYGKRHDLNLLYVKRALLSAHHESVSDLLLTRVGQLATTFERTKILLYDEFELKLTQQPKGVSQWLSTRHPLGVRVVRLMASSEESLLNWQPAQLRRLLDERLIFDLGGLTHEQQTTLVEAMNGRLQGFLIVEDLSSLTVSKAEAFAQQKQALNARCFLKKNGAVWLFLPADMGFWAGLEARLQRLTSKVYSSFSAHKCALDHRQSSWRNSIDFAIGAVPSSVLKSWHVLDVRAEATVNDPMLANPGRNLQSQRTPVGSRGAFWGESAKQFLLDQLPGIQPAKALYPTVNHEVRANRPIQFEWSASRVRAPRHQIDRMQPVRRFRIEIERKRNDYFRPFISEVSRVKRTTIKTLKAGSYRWRVKSICDQTICAVSPWSEFNVLER